MNFDDLLGVEIIPVHACLEESSDLVKRLDICQEAKSQFLALKISWQDYLDLIEVAGVDMNHYLNTSNENAITLGF